MIENKNKVLFIAAHPDDETLGFGGTILKHKKAGDELTWLIVANVYTNHEHSMGVTPEKKQEVVAVNEAYGFDNMYDLGLVATKIDQLPRFNLIQKILEIVKKTEPNIIYLQHFGDAHSDHKEVFDAVFTCTKSFRYPYVKQVYVAETLSETEFAAPIVNNAFIPNHFVDISEFIDEKIRIMDIYQTENGEHPFPRSEKNLRALATIRGAQAGVDSAEAFMCLKYLR